MSTRPEEISNVIKEQIKNYKSKIEMKETGTVIVEAFKDKKAKEVPGALVCSHGPFSWGKDADQAVYHAVVLEEVAAMALFTEQLGRKEPMQNELLEVHYQRKHGKNAYYGQK